MNKKHIHIALTLLATSLLFPKFALANAGTVLTSAHDNKHYVLLVQTHKHDYFEFPGGKSEKVSNLISAKDKLESDFETAIRETVEETRGYLGRQRLTQATSKFKKFAKGKYAFYLATLPFFDLNEIRQIKLPNKKKCAPMLEVADYAWVDVNLILQNNKRTVISRAGKAILLHDIVAEVIKAGQAKQWF